MDAESTQNNPLGLNLDFLFGRGYLWAKNERLSDWIELDHLRMEIPDLAFPFDARSGLHRFRNTRCLVREIEISTSEVGLADLVSRAAKEVHGFDAIDVHFLDGAIHVSARVKSLGASAFISFRVALIPPEPSRADEVHVSIYDYRAYGTLPFPARILVAELMTRILSTPALRPPGRGDSFSIGIAGDILRVRPLKLLLLHLFPHVGWKLPNLSNITLDQAHIRPGRLTLRALSPENWEPQKASFRTPLVATTEGGRALAAYEAKDLFSHGDQAIFDRQLPQALDQFFGYRDIYGNHPELIARLFDLLLADPSVSNLAHLDAICDELEREDPDDLNAAVARMRAARVRSDNARSIASLKRIAELLHQRGETLDWILCQLSLAELLESQSPKEAAAILREILRVSPRNQIVLEQLKRIYENESESAGVEDVLKRLTGVYTDREKLTQTYLELAQHLMNRQGELAEARVYLERVLRLDPTQLDALYTLGESYLLSLEPLRALKAFGSAARSAQVRQQNSRASQLHEKAAKIWLEHVQDPQQALLSARRALELSDERPDAERADLLRWVADLCATHDRLDEAVTYLVGALEILERKSSKEEEIEIHHKLAEIFTLRQRDDSAASHLRRVLELAPADPVAATKLEEHYKLSGSPEQLLELFRFLENQRDSKADKADLALKTADVFKHLGMIEDAASALERALDLGHPRALDHLTQLLERSQLFGRLRDVLARKLPQIEERDARWEVLVSLGRTSLFGLADAPAATRYYMEALQVRPTQLEALYGARDALEVIVSKDYHAPSPVGQGPASRLLERIVSRLAEVSPDHELQRDALIRLAELATLRGDQEQARVASERASGLARSGKVDERLDELLGNPFEEVTSPEEAKEPANVHEFRREFEQTIKKPHSIPPLESLSAKSLVPKGLSAPKPQDFVQKVNDARASDDPSELAGALEALVTAAKEGRVLLDADEIVRHSKELGELYYYDLEESKPALAHLEFVRESDPEGVGAQPGIMNALEAIYEETGHAEGRIKILEERLARAESEEMDTVYRLLLAQLIWETFGDRDRAGTWLNRILEKEPRHEAAHRLLAEIARELEDWEAAAEHLRTVLAVSSGGLDSVETERELAKILSDHLGKPRQAIQHLRSVLEAAPGDSGALNMLKSAQVKLGDWKGYTESLLLELSLLTGRKDLDVLALTTLEAESIPTPLRIPASQIVSDLAHVVEAELESLDEARHLWKLVHRLWPDHVEALERRIEINRKLGAKRDLAQDLEAYADLLLDPNERFRVLRESGLLHHEIGETDAARVLLTQAIAIAESADVATDKVDEVRRALQALTT